MFFSDLILRMLLILKELSSLSFLEVLLKVTFRSSQNLGLGSLTARKRRTFGHLIGSISFTSPSSALKEERLSSMPERMAVCSSSLAEGRISSSTTRHILMRFLSQSEQYSGISSQVPSMTLRQREGKSRPRKGILRQHISQSSTPSDQISHLLPYFRPFQISGLVQQGVPVWVSQSPCSATLETLRSPSLAMPLTKNMLALLMSRWMILWAWSILSPCRISQATFQTYFSSKPGFSCSRSSCTRPCRSPPSAYSMRMHSELLSWSKSEALQAMTLGIWMEASSRTSFSALSFYFWVSLPSDTVFMASSWQSSSLRTSRTDPNDPEPSSFTVQKSESFSIEEYCSIDVQQKNTGLAVCALLKPSDEANQPAPLPHAGHYALLAHEGALFLDLLAGNLPHESFPAAECADHAALHQPALEVPVDLDYPLLSLLREQEQHQLAPAVQLSAPPLSLVHCLLAQQQLTEPRGLFALVAAADVLQPSDEGDLDELVLDPLPPEGVQTGCSDVLQQLHDCPHWFLETHCCFLDPRPELAGGDAGAGLPFLLSVLQLGLRDGTVPFITLANILLVILVVDPPHSFDPVDGVVALLLLHWFQGGLHALVVVVLQEFQRILVVVDLAALNYEALLAPGVGSTRGYLIRVAGLFDQL